MTGYKSRYRYRKAHKIKKKKSIFQSRFFWIFLLALIFLGTAFYFIIFYQYFQVKEFRISGNNKINSQDIETLVKEKTGQRLLFFQTKSIFFVSAKNITQSLLKKYPIIEQASLKKEYPATLIIEIEERSPVAVFCQEDCFFIDKNGVIFDWGPREYDLVIEAQNKEDSCLGKNIIAQDKLNSILEIRDKLKTNLNINPAKFLIKENDRIDVKTAEGWDIYFDLRNPIDWQLTKLSLVLEKEIPPEKRGDLEYIDLRFGNFAPFKYRTASASSTSASSTE